MSPLFLTLSNTGEKPYSCSYCNSKFTQKYHASEHEKNVHSSKTKYGVLENQKKNQSKTHKSNISKYRSTQGPVHWSVQGSFQDESVQDVQNSKAEDAESDKESNSDTNKENIEPIANFGTNAEGQEFEELKVHEEHLGNKVSNITKKTFSPVNQPISVLD